MKWKFFKRFHEKEVQEMDEDQFYEYFEFESSFYVLDKETTNLYEILENSFKRIKISSSNSKVLNEGDIISKDAALSHSNFNYVPAHIEEWLYGEPLYKYFDYESTIYVLNNSTWDMYEMKSGKEVTNPEQFSRISSDGSVLSKDNVYGR